jgi:hypothetical protein
MVVVVVVVMISQACGGCSPMMWKGLGALMVLQQASDHRW